MKRIIITRGAALGILVSWLALLAAVAWIFWLSQQLHDTQQQNMRLIAKQAQLVRQDARTLTLVCKLSTGLALNQPDLDPRFLRILDEVIGSLPSKCFP